MHRLQEYRKNKLYSHFQTPYYVMHIYENDIQSALMLNAQMTSSNISRVCENKNNDHTSLQSHNNINCNINSDDG
jgi:hypothetical protein